MNRIIVVISLCILTVSVVKAQPNLDASTIPTPNKVIDFKNADTVGVSAGQPGIGVVWDYSTLSLREQRTMRYLNRQSLPPSVIALFPTVQFGVVDDTTTFAYRTVGSTVQLLGSVTPNSLNVVSPNDPYDTRPVEIVFNEPHNDTWKARITQFTPTDIVRRGADLFLVYEGFGTLRLPEGTFNNVAMVTERRTIQDTVRSLGNGVSVMTRQTTTWWIIIGSDVPLLEIVESESTRMRNGLPMGPPAYNKRVRTYSQTINSVDEPHSHQLRLSPLPATDRIRVEGLDEEIDGVELVDITGKTVGGVEVVSRQEGSIELALPPSTNGVYLLVFYRRCVEGRCDPITKTVVIGQ